MHRNVSRSQACQTVRQYPIRIVRYLERPHSDSVCSVVCMHEECAELAVGAHNVALFELS